MSETTKNRLYLMITITNRVMGATHFLDFYRAFGAPVVFTALGRGTACLLYTSPSPRDISGSRMPSSA